MKHDAVISVINFHYLYLDNFHCKHTHTYTGVTSLENHHIIQFIQLLPCSIYNSIWLSTESPHFYIFINMYTTISC